VATLTISKSSPSRKWLSPAPYGGLAYYNLGSTLFLFPLCSSSLALDVFALEHDDVDDVNDVNAGSGSPLCWPVFTACLLTD